ncbi:MAG: family 10 glycosylhydrolase [Oscillospiraceae bacterium]|nr:family 10 glycosylhydrolase [Oscillospiraceae bacterium]
MKKFLLFTISCAILIISMPNAAVLKTGASDSGYKTGNNELRGVWVASVNNIDFPSRQGLSAEQQKAELDDIVKTAKEAGLNAIFFQARPSSDALYNSDIFPVSQWLTGIQGSVLTGGFDPLEYITEKAHENNIELHAWLNPYRITQGTAANPSHNLEALAVSNPARQNPDWVVKYADGRMYYNPGLPEVRNLITHGVLEIINNYDVDGIHFDDYFYPYPVTGAHFNDDAAFSRHGGGKSRDDWRRENVNILIKNVYDAIKRVKPEVRFGVSPFGIWANDNTDSAGSATRGLQAYYAIYSDARAWANGGYVDYICPQIYWAFNTEVAPFDILVRWWSTLLDGTGVDLYIGHAVYKLESDFKSELEILRQVEYARQYISVYGSVFYGYKDLRADSYKIKTNLARLFAEPLAVPKPVNNGRGVTIGRPANNSTVTTNNVYIMAGSNPAFPVYFNNKKMTRTKSGFFSVFAPLNSGRNNLVFTQNNSSLTHTVTRGSSARGGDYIYPQMDKYEIVLLSPSADVVTRPGERVQVRVQAPSGSRVTVKLGGASVTLEPESAPPNEGRFMTTVYSGTVTLPSTRPNGAPLDLGKLTFAASRGSGEAAELTGHSIKLVNSTIIGLVCEVVRDFASLKTAVDSSWVNDYTPAAPGMRDRITEFENGYYKLSFGGFIAARDVVTVPERNLVTNRIMSAAMEDMGDVTEIRFGVSENVPVDIKCRNGVFTLKLFNTPDGGRSLALTDNPMFNRVTASSSRSERSVTYTLNLIHPDNFYGFEVVYENGFIKIRVKNPIKTPQGSRPLEGMTVVVDAGHGGSDPGALGFMGARGKNEADIALDAALELREVLNEMGAEVVMTRESNRTFALADRAFFANDAEPDLLVSIHYNSMGDAQDNTRIRSVLPLYSNESGRLLTTNIGRGLSEGINRVLRDTRYQDLGIARNHKFPAALIEVAFITNPDEYEFAMSAEGNRRTAQGIADGIVMWLEAQQRFIK